MTGYIANIEELTLKNTYFRQVLYTGQHAQVVLMCLKPNEDIGFEVHAIVDQFLRVEKGDGKAIIDGVEQEVHAGYAIVVPAGARHNVINTSATQVMQLYTVYSPPHHKDATIHKTKADAERDAADHL